MRSKIRVAVFCYFAILGSCASTKMGIQPFTPRLSPIHQGVDKEVQPYLSEYMTLAKSQGIVFPDKITIGFFDIKEPLVIGWTYYQMTFREIDFDRGYWNHASEMSRKMLAFHEFTHGYCDRDHDYGNGVAYPAPNHSGMFGLIDHFFPMMTPLQPSEGYFSDTCPLSIMHPVHLDDDCAEAHYQEYVKEMFNRCKPY